MELRDLAERILFATSLEEKLALPELGSITDEHPGHALVAPPAPGRPANLRFKPSGTGRGEFPGCRHLERPAERGRLLHFFANHELLATELMALVLLRFPDAPPSFRRGVLQTLRDEQDHTRLYVQRMEESGVTFGELPVSGYFWRAISGMESPIDYVAGLSLTFEQANLDFCRHFAGAFHQIGDAQTSTLLQGIYRDEIAHVAYGLKWFRRWKNPDESDWEAFCRQLKFPLSPQRAKGFSLNVQGRREAGLDTEFIAELDVFSQSKGRTPVVHYFNPFAEGFLARGRGFTPVKAQAQLLTDLAHLPQFLCRQDDLVLVPERPPVEFLSRLKQAGFTLPEFVAFQPPRPGDGSLPKVAALLVGRKLGGLRPWAWGPDSQEVLAPLFAQVTDDRRSATDCFNPGIASLYSKTWSADFLRRTLTDLAARSPIPLCALEEVGVEVRDPASALNLIAHLREQGVARVVAKEALGLAGQNALRLWEPEVLENQRRWLERATDGGRSIVIEPWLARVHDFSVQWEMEATGLRRCGFTTLVNDLRGQYQANWAAPQFERRPPASVAEAFPEVRHAAGAIEELYGQLAHRLEPALRALGYRGPVGVDAFVYRADDGRFRLKPIVELNPRFTMGRLTLELMRQVAPGSYGVFRLVNASMLRAQGGASFTDFARQLTERHPLHLAGAPVPRIVEGVVCLNEPRLAQACLAVFQVSRGRPLADHLIR